MNLSETIEHLLSQGVFMIKIGNSPTSKGLLFVQAEQGLATGPGGNMLNVAHQCEGLSLVNCIEQIKRQVDHCNDLKTRVVQLRGKN